MGCVITTHNLDELVSTSHRVLLLQGPIGRFFQVLGDWLFSQNKMIFKINFNSGDDYFYPQSDNPVNPIAYQGALNAFPEFLDKFILEHNIDTLICFGDNRPYHVMAKDLANARGLNFWAFEEGYFRPHYVTLEKSGVNAYSPIPRQADFFWAQDVAEVQDPEEVAPGFLPVAKLATQYYCCTHWDNGKYPLYEHHRILNLLYYIKLWVVSGIKRLGYWLGDYTFSQKVKQQKFGKFYIVPLQVYDDSQVRIHSDFNSVGDFLKHVLDSFVQHAPADLTLIVKHHPMDRGFIDYSHIIKDYIKRYPHIKNRLYYVHDVMMPVFLRHAKGMITLNSTSGLSALLHNMPVITLGRAHYDIPGLTHQKSLTEFWHTPEQPNSALFRQYHLYHMNKTQINGSFYKRVVLRYPYNLYK